MENKKASKKINLIPAEMAVPARAVKLAKVITKVSTVAVIILIVTSLALGGLIFYFSNESKNIENRISTLRSRITNLQQGEQKLVLAKDRLAKITTIQKLKSVNDEIARFRKFSDIVLNSGGSTISEANLNSSGTEVSLLTQSSSGLSQLLKPLATFTDYTRIILTSLGYNPGTGFISTINLEN